ncbi:uncharacterized protein BO72DRAFT_175699 [Aspergillus fijiensis CBS 313.89]|uniref:EF-hand domain-containing protein n=1 Tax=Aspergillus fijiensis CBS 313.89 TaxID=1448319 RepID=A0A8G1RZ23_9EURO|nr:uncharacterized protein BO72DRAFT_175699 [Aspergillus fijiensis CBS 313.89]RAK81643.1 hypothetical protein BO72DRAFT_175699 [Aspergillus fijiensis CBS 313.89]
MGWDIRQSPYAPLRSCLVAMVGGWGRRHDKAHTRQPQVMAGGRDGPGLCKCSFALPCSMYIVKGPGWVVGTGLGYFFFHSWDQVSSMLFCARGSRCGLPPPIVFPRLGGWLGWAWDIDGDGRVSFGEVG